VRTDGAGDFSISCVRTVRVHTACSVRTLTWGVFLWLPRFFGQCSPISVSVYANSRTPDIGKVSGEELIRPLVLGVVGGVFFGRKYYSKRMWGY
jgi:hypothetical protein